MNRRNVSYAPASLMPRLIRYSIRTNTILVIATWRSPSRLVLIKRNSKEIWREVSLPPVNTVVANFIQKMAEQYKTDIRQNARQLFSRQADRGFATSILRGWY